MERSEEHVGRVVNEAGWRQGQELNLGRPCTKQFGNYPKCGWEITENLRAGNMLSPFVTGNAMQMFLIIIVFLIIGEAVWGPVSPLLRTGKPAIFLQFHICRLEAQRQRGPVPGCRASLLLLLVGTGCRVEED